MGESEEEDHGWQFGPGAVEALPSAPVFTMWYENWRTGLWPRSGGWLDQPLALLVQIKTIDLLVSAKRYMAAKDSDWSKLSALQVDLIRWLRNEKDSDG